ncbi:SDR family oxidoreductase [Paludibaculum fermentans]|uniref:SDR family oxidoreductase n=1 Tax=Paludibaculum fermentans TaxID=1473598 RepID=UPI001E5D6E73|nr:NAD(P)H-binding protein [Paludibaculum fermentans]
MVLVTGGTGYLGRALCEVLLARGASVRVLVRPGGEPRAPRGAVLHLGDALNPDSVTVAAQGCDTLVHLVGTPHPASWKQAEFERVDRTSLFASVDAARRAGIRHFVYVSVAHPAPAMQGYIAIRTQCEQRILEAGLNATILRPWYVLGAGHRWPLILVPFYWLAERLGPTRAAALRLGLVTHAQMLLALRWAVETPHAEAGPRIVDVAGIRAIAAAGAEA